MTSRDGLETEVKSRVHRYRKLTHPPPPRCDISRGTVRTRYSYMSSLLGALLCSARPDRVATASVSYLRGQAAEQCVERSGMQCRAGSSSRAWSGLPSSTTTSISMAPRPRWCSGRNSFPPPRRARNPWRPLRPSASPSLHAPLGRFSSAISATASAANRRWLPRWSPWGLSTTLIGVLPDYASAGALAPLLLCLLRLGQGIGLGGEWGGAALLATENAPRGRQAWFGMFPQLGPPAGFLLSNGLFLLLFSLLTEAQFTAWGWRIPVPRQRLSRNGRPLCPAAHRRDPAFAHMAARGEQVRVPLGEVLRKHGPEFGARIPRNGRGPMPPSTSRPCSPSITARASAISRETSFFSFYAWRSWRWS